MGKMLKKYYENIVRNGVGRIETFTFAASANRVETI
jgi:hypothetical protein